jgi:hypothetical protein
LAESHQLYQCYDKLLKHKTALFDHLTERWKTLFNAKFEVLLYDLTSTYFESDSPFPESDKRKFGYSRDKRSDCVQVVIALIVTPEGFPIAYEVLAGNTADKTTLRDFLKKIETQHGKADRIWIMDRGLMPPPPGSCTLRAACGNLGFAYLVPGLLPADDPQGLSETPRQRPASTGRDRKICRRADARRAPSNNRRPRNRSHPPYPARKRPPASARTTQNDNTRAGTPENLLPPAYPKPRAAVVPNF